MNSMGSAIWVSEENLRKVEAIKAARGVRTKSAVLTAAINREVEVLTLNPKFRAKYEAALKGEEDASQ